MTENGSKKLRQKQIMTYEKSFKTKLMAFSTDPRGHKSKQQETRSTLFSSHLFFNKIYFLVSSFIFFLTYISNILLHLIHEVSNGTRGTKSFNWIIEELRIITYKVKNTIVKKNNKPREVKIGKDWDGQKITTEAMSMAINNKKPRFVCYWLRPQRIWNNLRNLNHCIPLFKLSWIRFQQFLKYLISCSNHFSTNVKTATSMFWFSHGRTKYIDLPKTKSWAPWWFVLFLDWNSQ